jgi:hypothetical protein
MLNQPKPIIDVMFSSQYPEEAKKDIHNLLKEKFELNISKRVSFKKDETVWIILTLAFLDGALKLFLKEFIKESGKLLARRLFQSSNHISDTNRPINVQIVIEYSEQKIIVTGNDEDELYQNLLEVKKKIEESS